MPCTAAVLHLRPGAAECTCCMSTARLVAYPLPLLQCQPQVVVRQPRSFRAPAWSARLPLLREAVPAWACWPRTRRKKRASAPRLLHAGMYIASNSMVQAATDMVLLVVEAAVQMQTRLMAQGQMATAQHHLGPRATASGFRTFCKLREEPPFLRVGMCTACSSKEELPPQLKLQLNLLLLKLQPNCLPQHPTGRQPQVQVHLEQ
mmetsp:Transcript_9389/g.17001  ORF Transcript_9389/g.17001 Transcript_9389/m.17001 type:complete len:205 (+) Transcript_9389:518-1132(+)